MNQTTPLLQRLPVLWAFLSYLGLTLILTDPLIRQIGSALPSDPGDPILNTWMLAIYFIQVTPTCCGRQITAFWRI